MYSRERSQCDNIVFIISWLSWCSPARAQVKEAEVWAKESIESDEMDEGDD